MSRLTLPITETPNELTLDIDVASPLGKARLLRQANAQIFTGWRDLPGAPSPSLLSHWQRSALNSRVSLCYSCAA